MQRIDHLPSSKHRSFYNAQQFPLNVIRADMIQAGYSPSVRLFEAAACGVPIISDFWQGLETIFEIGTGILVANSTDVDPHYLKQANWAKKQLGLESNVEFQQMQVYDLANLHESFDLVLFMGVFYHLRYPLFGLDIVSQKVKHLLVFQTLSMLGETIYQNTEHQGIENRHALNEKGWPKMAFIEHSFEGDPTNWWIPNHAGVEAMLRSCGLKIVGYLGHEIYLCELDPANPTSIQTWNQREFLAATGQPWRTST